MFLQVDLSSMLSTLLSGKPSLVYTYNVEAKKKCYNSERRHWLHLLELCDVRQFFNFSMPRFFICGVGLIALVW